MGKTKSLRTLVRNAILEVTTLPVYYGQAQTEARTGYIIYSVDEVSNADGRVLYETEINVIGYGTDTSTVEDLADSIQKSLGGRFMINDDVAVYFYAEQKNTVTEEDTSIIRRRMTFATYLYERN